MNKSFTASEVRDRNRFEEWYATHSFNYSRDPIGSRDCSLQWEAWKAARADLLEAQEKAEPVAYAEFADNGCVRMWSREYKDRLLGTRMVPLYTHAAQAQPPAARVTDAMVERGLKACIQDSDARLPRYKVVRSIIEAALAAQENPNG